MRVVLDTNIWLSAVFWKGEASKVIESCATKKIELVITENIVSEIVEIVNREAKFQKFIKNLKESVEELVRTILSIATLIETQSKIELIKDHPKDNMILEAALDGKADYIVSYDKHILDMLEFREIQILEPGAFLKLMK